MQRRAFVIGGLAVVGMPQFAAAQQRAKMPRVGVMLAQPIPNLFMDAFRDGLRALGYIEGQNIQVEYRSADGITEQFSVIAGELVRLKPDVIVAGGGGAGIQAAMRATSAVP